MRILIDIDNTIENLIEIWVESLNQTYGTNVSPDDITDWDICRFFPTLTEKEVFSEIKKEGFWKKAEPIGGAPEYVKKLIDDGHEVYFCSATDCYDIRPKYEDFLCRYFPFVDWSHIIFCSNKQIIKADVLVDDGIHNLENGEYIKILYSQPQNSWYDEKKHGMYRVSDWKEAYELINSL